MKLFVTGTDTGVGKTEVARALIDLMHHPFALKPYQSGGGDDAKLLNAHVLYRFKAPLAPGVAAEREGVKPSFARAVGVIRGLSGNVVVEGAGGLYVPIDSRHDVIDLIEAVRLPVVLVARAGLGTLNHTALSLEALKARRIRVAAVVLVKSRPGKDPSEADNPAWLKRRHPRVRVVGPVPYIANVKKRRSAFRRAVAVLTRGS